MPLNSILEQLETDYGSILVVDDSKTARTFLDRLFSEAGYTVQTAQDGQQALQILQEKPVQLIVSDHEMPVMNGLDLCNRIKSDPKFKSIYFIMLSTREQLKDKILGLSVGADDYVVKTTAAEELLARVKAGFRVTILQDELKNAYRHLYQQEQLASVGHLAAGVAHEINNPIGFVISNLTTIDRYVKKFVEYIEALTKKLEASGCVVDELQTLRKQFDIDYFIEDSKGLISESLDGAGRISKIVKRMRTFARIDMAKDESINVNESIDTCLDLVLHAMNEDCKVIKDYGDFPEIRGDGQQLNQVFLSLLLNAAQSVSGYGQIRIKTWVEENSVRVSVADTGCGISPENLTRIFNPFFTTREIGSGIGLGLSTCHEIIKQHGGEIKVTSVVGQGSVFKIRIPFAACPLDDS